MRGGKVISLNIFSVQEHASSKSRHILNFRIVAVRGISYKRVCRKIYTYIGIFSSFRSKSTRKSAYSLFDSSVLVISGLDNKSKFQMFTLFSGRHVGVPWRWICRQRPSSREHSTTRRCTMEVGEFQFIHRNFLYAGNVNFQAQWGFGWIQTPGNVFACTKTQERIRSNRFNAHINLISKLMPPKSYLTQ